MITKSTNKEIKKQQQQTHTHIQGGSSTTIIVLFCRIRATRGLRKRKINANGTNTTIVTVATETHIKKRDGNEQQEWTKRTTNLTAPSTVKQPIRNNQRRLRLGFRRERVARKTEAFNGAKQREEQGFPLSSFQNGLNPIPFPNLLF